MNEIKKSSSLAGYQIFNEGLNIADTIYLNTIPEIIDIPNSIYFPQIPNNFILQSSTTDDEGIVYEKYIKQ